MGKKIVLKTMASLSIAVLFAVMSVEAEENVQNIEQKGGELSVNEEIFPDVYNQRLIPFDTKMAVQTIKITAFEGKNACRKPLFLFSEIM